VFPVRDQRHCVPCAGAFRGSSACRVRIVLDECVPWPLAKHLGVHTCTSPQRSGWGGFENGDLLRLAEADYDLFVTSDQNLRYQQNLSHRKIAILELSTNDWATIKLHIDEVVARIESMKAGEFAQHNVGPVIE
jgi:hypothetical protein